MTLKMGSKLRDVISLLKTLIWSRDFILRLLRHTVDQFKISSAESDSYQSESSRSENLSDIWSDNGEEKEQELNENLGMLFPF